MNEIISVCVVSYNAELTVLETLNSIKNQTYGCSNIELVIADDASKDGTVKIIEEWLQENGKIFHGSIFIKHTVNIGITKNLNSAWKKSQSRWVKTIAADDILLPSCLESNITFAASNDIKSVIFSKMRCFSTNGTNGTNARTEMEIYPSPYQQKILTGGREQQYRYLVSSGGFAVAPSSFIYRDLLIKLNYGDERFPMIEDAPMWIKVLEHGESLYFMDEVTVLYRKSNSVSQSVNLLFNINHILQQFSVEVILNNCKCTLVTKLRKYFYMAIVLFIFTMFEAKPNLFSKLLYRLALLCKPYWLANRLSMKNKM